MRRWARGFFVRQGKKTQIYRHISSFFAAVLRKISRPDVCGNLNQHFLIIAHTKETDFAVFSANEVLQDCIAFRLVQISESAGHISAEFKAQYHTIPWHEISGLRNRLVHDYGNVDYRIVFDTVQEDIPALRDSLAKIV